MLMVLLMLFYYC